MSEWENESMIVWMNEQINSRWRDSLSLQISSNYKMRSQFQPPHDPDQSNRPNEPKFGMHAFMG